MEKRVAFVDVGAGIMILWMIIYHAISFSLNIQLLDYEGVIDVNSVTGNMYVNVGKDGHFIPKNPCVIFPYLNFFMPWFFYKSGQFFVKRKAKELWIKDVKKLLIPFLIWSLIGYLLFLLLHVVSHTLTWKNSTIYMASAFLKSGSIPLNLPLWFLLTLFVVRFIANICLPDMESIRERWKLLIIFFVCYVVTIVINSWHYRMLPEWIANSASGLVFFTFGYGLKKYEQKKWLFFPCLLVYLICGYVGYPIVDMHSNSLLAGYYWAWIPVAICSIVAFNSVCSIVCEFLKFKILSWIGRHSMQIFVSHFLILCTIDFVIRYFELVQFRPYSFWMMIGAYLLILPICCVCINSCGKIRVVERHNESQR